VLGLAGAAGFALGGLLVTLDLAGLGWRVVFPLSNVPFGLLIIFAALKIIAVGAATRGVPGLDVLGRDRAVHRAVVA